jgi:hypothetical protein
MLESRSSTNSINFRPLQNVVLEYNVPLSFQRVHLSEKSCCNQTGKRMKQNKVAHLNLFSNTTLKWNTDKEDLLTFVISW